MSRERIIMCWSGGKDSALALRELLHDPSVEVAGLLTTCTEGFRRISMHGVRCSLLSLQAQAIGLPVQKVFIPQRCTNEEYETRMLQAFHVIRNHGITRIAFGDLFLEEIRQYRDRLVAGAGLTAIYPVWGRDTRALARCFIADGFKAILVCVDPARLDMRFAGREFDAALLSDLPSSIDPCGENGEFHTFVYDGPIFQKPVRCRSGNVVTRDHFHFADLSPIR